MKLFAATSLCLALSALRPVSAQTCTPELGGLETGPYERGSLSLYSQILDMMPFDDASGSSLIVAGALYLPDWRYSSQSSQEVYSKAPAARYQNGHWSILRGEPPTSDSALSLAQADFSSQGGPGKSMYALLRPDASSVGIAKRWDGSTWVNAGTLPLSSGLSLLSHSDEQGPVLLLGGSNSQAIYAWRGTGTWAPYAPFGLSSGTVRRLRLIDDGSGPAVFAMGSMRDASRNLKALIKLVDGAWTQYDLPPAAATAGDVTDIATFDDGTSVNGPELYIAWQATNTCSVARLRNGSWETIAEGLSSLSTLSGCNLLVADVAGAPHLYLSGSTTLREWTASGWTVPFTTRYLSANPGGSVGAIVNFDDGHGNQTYFGGGFTDFFEGAPYPNNSATPAFGLVRTSERGITSMAGGVGLATNATPPQPTYLSSIELPEGPRLIVGGPISRAGGQYSNGAAMFDGANWFNFSAATQLLGELRSATVTTVNGQPRIVAYRLGASNLLYWDGSLWQPFAPVPDTSATNFMTLNGTLYAGVSPLKRFTGTSWDTVATGFNAATLADLGNGPRILLGTNDGVFEFDGTTLARVGPVGPRVVALAVVDDGPGPRLYVYAPALTNKIARLTNSTWEELPPGVHMVDSPVPLAIASFDDGNGPALYVAGHSASSASIVPGAIARWRNNAWSVAGPPIAQGQSEQIRYPAMTVVGDRLYISGSFARIGDVTADHLAWIQACPRTCTADFNGDGDSATDADIEAFFRCLAGSCCSRCIADFNNDGDFGTDADIESFFRVLAGGPC